MLKSDFREPLVRQKMVGQELVPYWTGRGGLDGGSGVVVGGEGEERLLRDGEEGGGECCAVVVGGEEGSRVS